MLEREREGFCHILTFTLHTRWHVGRESNLVAKGLRLKLAVMSCEVIGHCGKR